MKNPLATLIAGLFTVGLAQHATAAIVATDESDDELPRVAAPPVPPMPAVPPVPGHPAMAPFDGPRRTASKSDRRALTEDEKLAMVAIEGLMSMPAERAMPIVKKVLNGSQPLVVKERALFVLSQFDQPEAHALMMEYAKSKENPLRHHAIRSIGISGNPKSLGLLQEVYANGDAAIRRDVLQAWMIAGRKAEIYQVAAGAKTEADALDPIRMLSAMGAKEELRKLGDQQKNVKGLVEAYAVSGDLASLKKIASGTGPLGSRVDATRAIGIIGQDAAKTALRELYQASSEPSIKHAALEGMLIAKDQQSVLALYRAAKTNEEKRSLLRTLSVMGGDAALQAIDAALDAKEAKK